MGSKVKIVKNKKVITYREGPDWIEKIRLYYSTKLLNFAEKKPEMKSGFFYHLQILRHQQRVNSIRNFEENQIPKDTQIKLVGFQLIKLFSIEDLETFKKSLENAFPDKGEFLINWFDEYHGGFFSGGWQDQGMIVSDNKEGIIDPSRTCRIKGLTSEIEDIHLFSHQITPSLIALSLIISLTENSKTHFTNFFKQKYIFPTKIGRFYRKYGFISYNGTGLGNYGPEQEFWKWSNSIQNNVENIINTIFRDCSNNQETNLPRIDVFLLNENSESDDQNLSTKKNVGWKSSLGLDFPFFYSDVINGVDWVPNTIIGNQDYPTRIVVDTKKFLENNISSLGYSNEHYIWQLMESFLVEITIPLSIIAYFKREKEKINRLRKDVFKTENIEMKLRPRKLEKLVASVQSNYLTLYRVLKEYEIYKKLFDHKIHEFGKRFVINHKSGNLLSDDLQLEINDLQSLLLKYNDFIEDAITHIANVVNLRSTRMLAAISLIISVISLLLSIISLDIDLTNISDFIKGMMNIIKSLIS